MPRIKRNFLTVRRDPPNDDYPTTTAPVDAGYRNREPSAPVRAVDSDSVALLRLLCCLASLSLSSGQGAERGGGGGSESRFHSWANFSISSYSAFKRGVANLTRVLMQSASTSIMRWAADSGSLQIFGTRNQLSASRTIRPEASRKARSRGVFCVALFDRHED